ncbi:MAG: insulinase family protein [Acidobacteriota bacterium]|nr:insulinase family protein [Acidobacteriota bacterium]
MTTKNYFKKFTIPTLFLFLAVNFAVGQTAKLASPQQEKLLNGMNLLIWNVPTAEKATVKLRIHNGSAFDPQAKEGTMALLSDILFPSQAAKEFFQEDLGGSLEVTSNFDYIQIDATSDADQLIKMLDTLAVAIIKLNIDRETTAKVSAARLEKIKELEKNPAHIADLAVAKRLFGDFPYGRPPLGTSESVSKIDFADLILARQRFLTADNATLAVISNSKPDVVYRAVRRYFGAWEKSDKKVPATFRQPDAPQAGLAIKEFPIDNTSEFRLAFRNVARNNKDFHASEVLAKILQKRLQTREGNNAAVSNNAQLLNGSVVLSFSKWNVGRITKQGEQISLPKTDTIVKDLLNAPISQEEFEAANLNRLPTTTNDLADWWLDIDTFKLPAFKNEEQNAKNITLADVSRIAELWKKEPLAEFLVIGNYKTEASNK